MSDSASERLILYPGVHQAYVVIMGVAKNERIALRVTANQKSLISRAATSRGQTVTDFAVAAAVEKADEVVAESFHLTLGEASWEWFNELLDSPARELPGLRKALNRPSNFE